MAEKQTDNQLSYGDISFISDLTGLSDAFIRHIIKKRRNADTPGGRTVTYTIEELSKSKDSLRDKVRRYKYRQMCDAARHVDQLVVVPDDFLREYYGTDDKQAIQKQIKDAKD